MSLQKSQYLVDLPEPTVFKTVDFEKILSEITADFVARHTSYEEVVLESDPVKKVFESWAYARVTRNNEYNEDLKQTMLKYATGANLDMKAADLLIYRRVIKPADNTTNPPTPAVLESDESLRFRAQTSDRLAQVAGPKSAYERLSIEASEAVKEANVILPTPTPGEVHVYLRGIKGDGKVSAATIKAVTAFLSAEDRRPLNDKVVVRSGKIIDANLALLVTYYTGYAKEEINKKITEKLMALNEFLSFGDPLTYNLIHATARVPGVQNIEIFAPKNDILPASHEYVEIRGIEIKDKDEATA